MRPLLAVLIFQLFSAASFAAPARFPIVISFGGTGSAEIRRGDSVVPIEVGKKVEFGSVIHTGPENTVTIQYPDGSLVAIDADTRFEVQEKQGATQVNALYAGQARASIVKAKLKEAEKRPRFMIRTKAAVLGVRGTEFVIGVDPLKMTTQVHTLEGVVDVAASEGELMGGAAVSVPSGQFVEATESGVTPAQVFDRAGFEQSLAPSVPGGPAQLAFSGAGGATVLKTATVLPEANTRPGSLAAPVDTRREPEEKAPAASQVAQQAVVPEARSVESPPAHSAPRRPIRLLSFQGAAYFSPRMKEEGSPNGTGELIRAVALSWDPEFPVPLVSFLSIRGHVGGVIARDGSLAQKFLIREYQAFGTFSLLDRVFAEVGVGRVDVPGRGFSAGLVSTNIGFLGGAGGLFSRIFVGHSEIQSKNKEEQFRVGFGLSF